MQGTSKRETIFSGNNALYDPNMEKDMKRAGSRIGPGPGIRNIFDQDTKIKCQTFKTKMD